MHMRIIIAYYYHTENITLKVSNASACRFRWQVGALLILT